MTPLNILLIVSEDNGLQFGCYGDSTVPTPHVDRLAAEGTRFTNAYVAQAVCSPGRASIHTGLYPHQCGQFGLASHRYSMYEAYPTIPSLLHDAGYRTGLIGKLHVLPESAFTFDWIWRDAERNSFAHRDVPHVAERAREFMDADDQPFCLTVNYSDAHLPWLDQEFGLPDQPLSEAPLPAGVGVDSPRLRQKAGSYYNCISRLDSAIGSLLEQLDASGKADHTMVIYITDHGPQFSRGKCCVSELALRAPLIVRAPQLNHESGVANQLVSQIDILPTVLEATGVSGPTGLPGRSLLPYVTGNAPGPEYLFAEWTASHAGHRSGLFFPQRSVRDGRYKLVKTLVPGEASPVAAYYTEQWLIDTGCTQEEIDNSPESVRDAYACWQNPPPIELYDLAHDPHEFHNLADDPALAAIRERLLDALHNWQQETSDPFADPELLKRFRAEYDHVETLGGAHKQPDFRWQYPDYFPHRPV